jgi:hypothetical protein
MRSTGVDKLVQRPDNKQKFERMDTRKNGFSWPFVGVVILAVLDWFTHENVISCLEIYQ